GEINDDLVPELILAEPDDVPGVRGKVQAEATAVAQRILGLVGKLMIYDKENGSMRPCTFGDITILLRTAAGWAETFSRVLDEHGIPNRPDASTGYFDAVEVRTILSYLNVLDNPRQDIPLAASLRSQIGQLEDRELAVIRQEEGDGQFYDCILAYARCGKDPVIRGKLVSFLEMTEHLRSLVKDTPIHILLWRIFDESGYEDRIAALEGGRQKKANLELLVDMAMAYEETSYRGLFHFVRYIEKLRKAQKDIGQASGGTGRENLVRIMTMHKSKGLEFPVVFVCGLNKRFNQQDARGRIVMHEHLGAGLDYRDAALRTKTENRIRSAIAARITTDALGEELRVLYVAMTRAEQKLILTGCMDSRKKAVEKAMSFRACTEEKLPVSAIESAGCMLDWVLASLSRIALEQDFFDSGQWEGPQLREEEALDLPGSIRILTGVQVLGERAVMERKENRRLRDLLSQNPDQAADPALRERLESMLCHTYAWSGGRDHMPGKMSVSEIKHDAYEAELRRLAEEEGTLPAAGLPGSARARTTLEPDAQPGAGVAPESLPAGEAAAASMQMPDAALIEPPAFLREEAGGEEISGTAMGSAYHLVLAELDYEKHRTKEQVEALLETMLNCDKIQKREAARLDTGKIVRFVTSRLAERMRAAAKAGKLWREQPFVIAKNAGAVRPGWSNDEQILLQGIIDAFFIEEDGIVLVDYKTDRAKPGEEESLVRRYRVQFALYRDALEMLLGQPVKEAWLYSLSLHKAVQVALAPRQDTPAGTSESAAN
ncbi:MAG TPA: hypothetical protein DHV42_01470, partial [Lachnospiraceae bacterium]|nr:hypothetical protein [Lachnospiraceae bacterium]